MSVCRDCFVVSGRGLWVGLITCPKESYRVLMCLSEKVQAYWGLLSHDKKLQLIPGRIILKLGRVRRITNTGLFEMTVGVLTTCHKQYT